MPRTIFYWHAGPGLALAPARIAEELHYGEDVEGLVDLPIQEVIAQLKAAFTEHRELPGLLQLRGEEGPLQVTWSWQFVHLSGEALSAADQERVNRVVAAFGCQPFEPPPQL